MDSDQAKIALNPRSGLTIWFGLGGSGRPTAGEQPELGQRRGERRRGRHREQR